MAATGAARAAIEEGPAPERRGPTLDVREFGGAGTGRRNDAPAIQAALDAGARLGGAVVRLPPGTWRSGTVHLRSRVTLDLAPGAVLLASHDEDFAPCESPPFSTGSDHETIDFANALLCGGDLEWIGITGGGVIEMNRSGRFGPKPIALKRCRFVTVRGVTILHSPNYCVSLGGCDDVLIDGVTIRSGYADGIDPDCCRRVRITNCDVESDDDAICLKTSFLLGEPRSTEDVLVSNCRMRSPSNCFKLGTESTGDFRRIVVSNCVFSGLSPDEDLPAAAEGGGIAIETVDGGTIDGVTICNVVMTNIPAPIFVRLGNRARDQRGEVPGRLRNVSIDGIVAAGASGTSSITGLPGHPVDGITLENVRITTAGKASDTGDLDVPEQERDYPEVTMFGDLPASGLYLRHVREATVRNIQLVAEDADARAALVADDVTGLQLTSLGGAPGNAAGPVVWLNDVRGGLVQGSVAPDGVAVFVRVTGEKTRNLALLGNVYGRPGLVQLAPELAPEAVAQLDGSEMIAARRPPSIDG
jgi:polygalacturonase